ncbi:hypothetical protein DF039_12395 [Burkholderia cenocepacia]|nr:hypothetical protein DF039_12395 [Burkholderia cenocepacia]
MADSLRVPTLFPGERIAMAEGSEKLFREAAAYRAFVSAVDSLDLPDFGVQPPAPKRKLNRRRTSKRTFREPKGARLARRLRAYLNSDRVLTAPMVAALAILKGA